MSDESSRSARPYGQRRNDGAPTWWAALDRADLPDNEVVPAAHRRWYEDPEPVTPQLEIAARARPVPKRRVLLVSFLVAVVIAVVFGIVAALYPDEFGEIMTVALLIGIPVALAGAVTIVLARRNS
jgi:hypothetical protein